MTREEVEKLSEDLRIAGRFPTKADAERVLAALLSAWEDLEESEAETQARKEQWIECGEALNETRKHLSEAREERDEWERRTTQAYERFDRANTNALEADLRATRYRKLLVDAMVELKHASSNEGTRAEVAEHIRKAIEGETT